MRGRSGRRGAWLLSEKAERGQGRPALFCCRKKFCTNFKKMLTDVIFPDIINIVLMRSIRNGKVRYAAVAHLVERHLAKVEVASSSLVSRSTFSSQNRICGCSSSGRAPPCQGGGSEFEPRQPLQRKGTELIGAFVLSEGIIAADGQESAVPTAGGSAAVWRRRQEGTGHRWFPFPS